MTTALDGRRGLLRPFPEDREFRRFFPGYAVSLFGSAMAPIALAFAVLRTAGGAGALGLVLAARVLPLVLVLLAGGVAADRLGSRRVMLAADLLRCLSQGTFAVLLLTGRPPLWAVLALVAVGSAGEAVFSPALSALIPRLTPADQLSEANTLLTLARSTATVAGPALAGLLTAAAGPGAVLALDAASFAVSVLALARLTVRAPVAAPGPSLLADLRVGWSEFRSRSWLWTTCGHFGLFNLLVWAPFLVLGPATAAQRLGGARSWGLVLGAYGAGSVLGALALLGRRPRRPVLVATIATVGWAAAPAALALGAALPWVCAGAAVGGVGEAVNATFFSTAEQRLIPPEARARVASYTSLGAFALGPLGLAAAGPAAALLGSRTVFGFGALWLLAATATVLTVPSVRRN
ncbi:MFS family permease [Kitasatospora sp. GAS204A]|uniref:MFS transporter n=1 Tax=unclassified Kitasatospora TaxID=2633591 RepID=UPI0024752107|nr:MFS transporter [Kitasatospora sp. GAS204B]MDH6119630.1 MFS family permease [Kitasatospora sp. GAS204B]